MLVWTIDKSVFGDNEARKATEHDMVDGSCYMEISPRFDVPVRFPEDVELATWKSAGNHAKDHFEKEASCQPWLRSFNPVDVLKIDERSTTVGSAASDSWEDSSADELDDNSSQQAAETQEIWGNGKEMEEEPGAKEESEFSLDGRLATMKKWRRFRGPSLSAESSASSVVEVRKTRPSMKMTFDLHVPGPDCILRLAAPPGLSEMQHPADAAASEPLLPLQPSEDSFKLLNIDVHMLVQTAMPGLEQHIRLLSKRALGVDTWDALLKPDPEDPDWQLLALVGKDYLAGFSTYAFFQEETDDGIPGLIMSVHHVVVDEAHRGKGHGRMMIQDLLSRARRADAWAVKLHSKPSAVGFYERMGFKLIGPDHLMEMSLHDRS